MITTKKLFVQRFHDKKKVVKKLGNGGYVYKSIFGMMLKATLQGDKVFISTLDKGTQ